MKQKSKKKKGKSKMIGFVLFFYLFFGGTIFCQKNILFIFIFIFCSGFYPHFQEITKTKTKKKKPPFCF